MPKIISNTVQAHIACFPKGCDRPLFLLLKRAENETIYPNVWQAVTGWIEPGETALETALRELKEETGLVPKKSWTVPYITSFFDVKKDEIHLSPVFGFLVDEDAEIKLSEEHCAFEWLTYEDCCDKLIIPTHVEGTKVFCDFILCGSSGESYEIV